MLTANFKISALIRSESELGHSFLLTYAHSETLGLLKDNRRNLQGTVFQISECKQKENSLKKTEKVSHEMCFRAMCQHRYS